MVLSPRAGAAPRAALVGATEAEDLPEDVGESVLEVPVGHHVDDRVQGRVEVSDPEEDGDDDVGTRAVGVAADGHGQVPGKEGQPAEEKRPHHDAQRHEGLVLFPPRRVDPVTLAKS